jgi:hypothetical protein
MNDLRMECTGNRYNFSLIVDKVARTTSDDEQCYDITIYAYAKSANLTKPMLRSSIGNNNSILSMLRGLISSKQEDSFYTCIPRVKVVRILRRLTDCFLDPDALSHLEKEMDDDREAGEWEGSVICLHDV